MQCLVITGLSWPALGGTSWQGIMGSALETDMSRSGNSSVQCIFAVLPMISSVRPCPSAVYRHLASICCTGPRASPPCMHVLHDVYISATRRIALLSMRGACSGAIGAEGCQAA